MPGGAKPGAMQRAAQQFIVFENFEKMNTAALRQGLPERELAWQENLQAIAPNRLKIIPAAAASALATIQTALVSMFDATFGGADYIIAFGGDGSAYAINIATGVVNNFAAAGTFSDPDVTTWQADRVLINDPTSGYCTFDGTLFVHQGGVSPNIVVTNGGSGYSSAPSVTISGGSGTGATAHSVIQNGVVVAVILDNPGIGYQATDTLTVTFGTGVGSGATGHVTMTGYTIGSLLVTDPGSFINSPGTFPTRDLVFTGGSGSGAAGTATLAVDPVSGHLFVVSMTVTNPGSGYTSAPSVALLGGTSGGTPPILTAVLGVAAVATIVLDAGGTGYIAPPNVSIQGGNPDVAATAHATLSGTSVNALVLDTPGSGYTSTPTVIIGTGSGAAATAIVWPFVPAGTTLAVFGGRVWLGGDTLLQYTGTQGYDDFNSANAAGSLEITDADLVHAITALRAYNNYLFIMGDQSVKQIGNISLNTAGTATLFTILTLSSDQGTIYKNSCASYNRVFMFANKNGVYAVFGSSVQKISDDMDGIWEGIDFSTVFPQAALLDLNGIHNVCWLVKYADPFTGTTRSLVLVFNGKRWFPISQGELVSIVSTTTLADDERETWGSTGTDIRQLVADPTTAVPFRLQTSLSHHGNAVQNKKMIRAGFGYDLASGTGTITQIVETENNSQTNPRTISSGFHLLGYADGNDVSGVFLGQTLTGTMKGLTLSIVAIEFQDQALWPQK